MKYYITLFFLYPLWLIFPKNVSWKKLKNWLKPHKHIYWKPKKDWFAKCTHYWCNTVKLPVGFMDI